MQPADYLLALIGFAVLVAAYGFHRLVNSGGHVSWTVNTSHPEPNHVEITKLEQERDEAIRVADALRERIEKDATP